MVQTIKKKHYPNVAIADADGLKSHRSVKVMEVTTQKQRVACISWEEEEGKGNGEEDQEEEENEHEHDEEEEVEEEKEDEEDEKENYEDEDCWD
ncbi:hypothetical protein PoB_002138600 [Plakobranchus ocellatus]|uniref:Uncharacterized protein n=1 Tax=Plakobranchus ocellatus TaxID=259542 RepID=A0AAV3Z6C8_9GAST|nr:hypothetical protein PoB_002138600 [Plakobranchus ocellatus]